MYSREQVDLACEVLSLCMSNLTLGESTTRYDSSLEAALKHPYVPVRIMALTEIERSVKQDEPVHDLCRRISFLNSVIECIGNEDLSVATKATNIVTAIGLTDFGLSTLTSANVVDKIRDVMSINEIVRLRVFEVGKCVD